MNRRSRRAIGLAVCLWLVVLVACGHETAAPSRATVRFYFDAPFCGLKMPVQLLVDHAIVGMDTFAVNAGYSTPNHLTSNDFSVATGAHTLGATGAIGSGYAWPDKAVMLQDGQVFVDSLPFYCS